MSIALSPIAGWANLEWIDCEGLGRRVVYGEQAGSGLRQFVGDLRRVCMGFNIAVATYVWPRLAVIAKARGSQSSGKPD